MDKSWQKPSVNVRRGKPKILLIKLRRTELRSVLTGKLCDNRLHETELRGRQGDKMSNKKDCV